MLRLTILLIFTSTVLMSVLLVAIMLADSVPNPAGMPHPVNPGMQIGGDASLRQQHIGIYGFLFQGLFYLLVVSLCVLGVAKRYRTTTFYLCMGLSLLSMWLVWWQIFTHHQNFIVTGETNYFMGFPIATAWLVYGHWLSAVPLILIYTIGFHHFIYTEEDAARFNRLLKETRAESSQSKATH
ncbi:MAG: hypothetical protein OXE78_06620 [Gammaproteobacteria bacterium]|nr:hypothetical protein [Gammaproteobacteria bacterium]